MTKKKEKAAESQGANTPQSHGRLYLLKGFSGQIDRLVQNNMVSIEEMAQLYAMKRRMFDEYIGGGGNVLE